MTLDQIFEHGKEAAKHLFKEQGMIHPMWICESENGQMIPICVQMPERKQRDAFASALKLTFRQHKVARYVALLEAWVVEMPADTDVDKLDLSKSLEHHEDRREVVLVQAEDIDGTELVGRFYILRPENGKPRLSEFKDMTNTGKPNEGRFVHLLSMEDDDARRPHTQGKPTMGKDGQ